MSSTLETTESSTRTPQVPAEVRHAIIASALDEIRNGQSFSQISTKLGIPPRTLNHWLLSIVPDQYREAQHNGIIGKLLDAGEDLETAGSHLLVARAREVTKFWQWVATARLPAFAPKQEISGPGGGPIVIDTLERARRAQFVRNLDAIDVDVVHLSPTTAATT